MSPEGFLQSRGTLKNEQWQEAGVEGRLSLLFFFHVWAIVLKFKCNTQCIICPHKLPLGWFILSASFSGVPSGFLQVVPSNNDSSSSRNDQEWLVTWQTCGSSFVVNAEQRIWECFFSLSELCCSEETRASSLFKWEFFLPFIFSFISVYPWHFSKQAASSRSTICFSLQLWHHLKEYLLTLRNTCGMSE